MTDLEVALAAAAAGAAAIVGRRPGRVEQKGPRDLVTEVDLAAEAAIVAVLRSHRPDIPILAEEGGGAWDAGTRWVVDPLDGTMNFVHGVPWYAVSIALERDGVARVGVVWEVERGVAWMADDRGARKRQGGAEVPIAVSTTADLCSALVATGFATDHAERAAFYAGRVERMLAEARCVRRLGSAALDLALVAEGTFDVYLESSLRPWDVAAGALIVARAGGRVTDDRGDVLGGARPSPLASNGLLHEAALRAFVSDAL